MPKTAVALLATVLAAGLIAAGCGGDDDDDTTAAATATTGGEPPSKSEFIEQGDEICAEANQELQQANTAQEVADNIQGQIDGLRALTPPEGDEEEIAQILDTAEEGVDELSEAERPEQTPGLAEAARMLREYGFKECGS
jgi:hypothetical protein